MKKRKKGKRKRKEVKETKIERKEAKETEGKKFKYGFLLTLAGGCLIIVGGMLILYQILVHAPPEEFGQGYFFMFLAVINGLFIMGGGALGRAQERSRMGGIMSILYSITATFVGFGFINLVGVIVGILGGVLTFLNK